MCSRLLLLCNRYRVQPSFEHDERVLSIATLQIDYVCMDMRATKCHVPSFSFELRLVYVESYVLFRRRSKTKRLTHCSAGDDYSSNWVASCEQIQLVLMAKCQLLFPPTLSALAGRHHSMLIVQVIVELSFISIYEIINQWKLITIFTVDIEIAYKSYSAVPRLQVCVCRFACRPKIYECVTCESWGWSRCIRNVNTFIEERKGNGGMMRPRIVSTGKLHRVGHYSW
jgi:hypothetical protein